MLFEKIQNEDMSEFYIKHPEFKNALYYEKDEIAIGAFIGEMIVAVAWADNYLDPLW